MSKRRLSGWLAIILLVVSACGVTTSPSASSTSSAEASTSASATAVPPREPVTLSLWTHQSHYDGAKSLIEGYEKATGNTIKPEFFPGDTFNTSMLTKWGAEAHPDIIEWYPQTEYLRKLNPAENLRDLSGEAFVARQIPGMLKGSSLDGKVYAAVLTFPPAFGLFYNRQVFDRLGLQPAHTADELLNLCKAIKAADPSIAPIFEGAGSGWPDTFFPLEYMMDSVVGPWTQQYESRQVRLDDPDSPYLGGLKFQRLMLDSGCFNSDILTATYEDSIAAVMNGKAAMMSLNTGVVRDASAAFSQDQVDATLGYFAWAQNKPAILVAGGPSLTYYLPKTGDAAREAAALEFVRYVSGPAYAEYVKAKGVLPTMTDVPTPAGVVSTYIDAFNQLSEYPSAGLPDFSGLDQVGLTAANLSKQKSPEEIAADAQNQVEVGAEQAGLPTWPPTP